MRITGVVPLDGDVFTQEALDGLVGQDAPLVARPGDVTRPIGRATVVEARQEGDHLVLVVDTTPPERERDHVEALLGHVIEGIEQVTPLHQRRAAEAAEAPLSLGYTIGGASGLPEGHRSFEEVHLRVVGPSSMPFTREEPTDG